MNKLDHLIEEKIAWLNGQNFSDNEEWKLADRRAIRELVMEVWKELENKLISSYDQTHQRIGWFFSEEDKQKFKELMEKI